MDIWITKQDPPGVPIVIDASALRRRSKIEYTEPLALTIHPPTLEVQAGFVVV